MHYAHTGHHGQSPTVLRGQKELFAAAPYLTGFLFENLKASIVIGRRNQLPGISADDFTAKNAGHFLEDRVDKDNPISIVHDDDTVIQSFENRLHLLER